MIKRLALVATLAALGTTAAHAEFFGLPNGRSANPGNLPPLSVEGSFNTGGDYQHIGARVNYQVSPELVVFGDVGQSAFDLGFGSDADGLSFGIGAFFFLANQQILPQFDIAVKGSFHTASLESDVDGVVVPGFGVVGGGSADVDGTNISLEALISSQEPLSANGLGWYANGGINILGGDFDDTEILLGGGVTLPLGPGEIYGGADLIDDIIFGVGFRYFVQ